jgi:nicotinate-nucleotide adenylyltransferase
MKIGLLGGTFDPVHCAHVELALMARSVLHLDQVIFIPAGDPYQKGGRVVASATHRYAMVEAAVALFPGLAADRIDIDAAGPTFTIATLQRLRARAGWADYTLVWLLGADAFAGLPSWYQWRELFAYSHFAVLERIGEESKPRPAVLDEEWERRYLALAEWTGCTARSGRILSLDMAPAAISSTKVRAKLAAGSSASDLLPAPVSDYIQRHQLYRSPSLP